jgi:hypothetical protein
VGFQNGALPGSGPGIADAVRKRLRLRHLVRQEVGGAYRPAQAHLFEDPLRIFGMLGHGLLKTIRPHAVRFHAVPQQRPCGDRHDGRFVGPLLGKLAAGVRDIVEARAGVRAQPREEHQVMGGNEDVDEVELDQTQTADDTRDLACRRRPFGARLREALGA